VRVSSDTFAATCVCDVAFLSDDSFNQKDEGSKADGKVAMLSYRVCFLPLQYFCFDRLIRQTSLSIPRKQNKRTHHMMQALRHFYTLTR